jgi:hypothetical protein
LLNVSIGASKSSASQIRPTNSGGADHVWFCDVQADGWSLDDKRAHEQAIGSSAAFPAQVR